MQHNSNPQFAFSAESDSSDYCAMSANANTNIVKILTAIIPAMAVIFYVSVPRIIALDILISIIILGIIIVTVRGSLKPVSRT